MSRFTISVYQRKIHGQLEWSTLGLGPFNVSGVGRSPTKLQRTLADRLRVHIRAATPAAVARMELVRGRRLQRIHLELLIRTDSKPVKRSGFFPIIVERRWRTPETQVRIAYHPLRQDAWMLIDERRPLPDQLRRFFSKAWSAAPGGDLSRYTTDGKDALKVFSFSERGPQLVDELPDRDPDVFADLEPRPDRGGRNKKKRRGKFSRAVLAKVGENMTGRVADGLVPLGRPREPWRRQLSHLLDGPRKTSVVLIGPAGVGKSTLLYRWVSDLLDADDYRAHRNLDLVHEVWRIEARRVLAGMSYRGDWEERVVSLAAEATDPRVILWAADLHTFGRAGRSRDSERTIADVLRGPVSRGELTVVAEATPSQWHQLREDAPALADRFTTLTVTPTDERETVQMMLHEVRELEPRLRVRFSTDAYRSILALGEALHPGSAQPGLAIDLARRIAREASFERRASDHKLPGADPPWPVVDADAALRFLSQRTGLPEALLRPDTPLCVETLRRNFASHVLGQPEAVRAAVDLVTRIRAGLTDPARPFATYLFTGPTGTGKTQMAKTIAGFLYGDPTARLVRIDMGEMSGPESVARLIGDRYDPRGLLTDAVRQQPFCVVLLDEVEKAHPAVLQLLLQLLDEGRLTDAAGDTADFTKAVIVMTSNLGARPRAAAGFGERAEAILHDVARAVREFFPPELFNRIDRVVRFAPLTPEVAELVTEKELASLLARRGLADRRVFVFAHPSAVQRMAAQAFDGASGARSVKRFLEGTIGSLLSDELARGTRAQMRVIRIHGGQGGEYRLHVSELTEAEPLGQVFELEGCVEASTVALRARLPGLRSRVSALARSEAVERVRARRTELLRDPSGSRSSALYHLDRFLARVGSLRELLEEQAAALGDQRAEPEVSGERPASPRGQWRRTRAPQHPVRGMSRAAISGRPGPSRGAILAMLGEVSLLESALERLHEPEQHRVIVELLRVGQGRRPPSFEPDKPGLLEWMARLYQGLYEGAELVSAAAQDADGRVQEAALGAPGVVALDDLLALRPTLLALELEGVAVRTLLEGERGCHVWSSLLSGAEIVRVRLCEATSARAHLERHAADVRAFQEALSRSEGSLPDDPAGLLPAVRDLRFDPPERPGETSPLEVQDYVTGQVITSRVRSLDATLAALVWLRASGRPGS